MTLRLARRHSVTLKPVNDSDLPDNRSMFSWFKRKGTPAPPLLPPPPAHHDEVLGTIEWNPEDDGWVATVHVAPHPFRILIGGDERPDEHLLAHARDIFTAPEKLLAQLNELVRKEAIELPDWADEVSRLHLDRVALLWPDEPDGGIVYLDGSDTDGRLWQCDLDDRKLTGSLSYDD